MSKKKNKKIKSEFIKNNKLILIVLTFTLVAISGIVGYTYSFFQITVSNNNTITGEAEDLKFALEVTKVSPSEDNNDNLIPQLDDYITKAVTGISKSCTDANGNVICNVYKVTLKNESGSSVYVNGTLELTASNMTNLKWARISGTTNPALLSTVNNKNVTTLTSNELYAGMQEKDYYIVIWISETGESQVDSGSYSGVVTFTNVNPDES